MLVCDRELGDAWDVFRCLSAGTGAEVWTHQYPAEHKFDYGNSPRATPLVHGSHVYCFGGGGQLSCLVLETGELVWQKDLRSEFGVEADLKWGHCGSPLLVAGLLVVQPGGAEAALVALRPADGEVVWQAPGRAPGYGSLIVADLGGKRQIVGHDAETLGGWELATGRRLWTVEPPRAGDFNVPTPLVHAGGVIVCTENNGVRWFTFDGGGKIEATPRATSPDLVSDTHTPVLVGNRLFGVSGGDLLCLDLQQNLKLLWSGGDPMLAGHVSLLAADDTLLASTERGELLLIDAHADALKILGRHTPLAGEAGLLSHPALVGRRLYLRGSQEIVCLELAAAPP